MEKGATSAERRAAARDLLMEQGAAIAPRLCEILTSGSTAARLAVARAIAETPQRADSVYSSALLGMLDADDDLRAAAVAALATVRDDSLVERLAAIVDDAGRSERSRVAAIEVLGASTRRDAIEVLIASMADPTSPLCGPAVAALEKATAQDFGGDPSAALTWWQASSDVALPAWQQLQIERLVRQTSTDRQRVRVLEGRITGLMRDAFVRADESARPALLVTYLSDETDVIRLLGLELVLARLTEAKVVRPDAIAEVRKLLDAAEPTVRSAAARALAGLRDAADESRLTARLAVESNSGVRQALVYGLGYLGGPAALGTLLHAVAESDEPTRDEAVAAIGRLAERGLIEGANREPVVAVLLDRAGSSRRSSASRERMVRAMSRIPDERFADVFVRSLSPAETNATRLAAIRGIQFLVGSPTGQGGPSSAPASREAARSAALVAALLPLCSDTSAVVRRASIEAVGEVGFGCLACTALWAAALDTRDMDESTRGGAWQALGKVVARSDARELTAWALRVGDDETVWPAKRIDLLRLIEERLVAAGTGPGDMGLLRMRLGRACLAAARYDLAAESFRAAMSDLRRIDAAQTTAAADGYLLSMLNAGTYCEAAADALFEVSAEADMRQVAQACLTEIAGCVEPATADRACAMIGQLQAHLPADWTETDRLRLEELRARAVGLRDAAEDAGLAVAAAALRRGNESAARAHLAELGSRAVPALQRLLLRALSDPAASGLEGDLVSLLKMALPSWPGYSPQSPLGQRILAVESAGAM